MGVCLVLVLAADVVCAGSVAALATPWVGLFTSDERVVRGAVEAMPWMAAAVLMDG